ncbi:MAG TPA: GMC family oxidoreductase [Hanamia sp.]
MGDSSTSIKDRTFDAIVIGSGMSGGWSAKELSEKGLKTLVLERGRDVKHIIDYPTAHKYPWEFEHRLQMPLAIKEANPVVSKHYAFKEDAAHFMVKDAEHPYIQEKPFDWIRAYQVGGKSLLWARATQRWSDFDFEGPARDGYAVDWPIRYKDIAPWYSHVEKFVGISGNKDGLPELPDGEFLPAMELNCVESYFRDVVKKHYKDRHVIYGRCAHITEARPIHLEQGRGKCQNRTMCQRGCPFGGYYSSNSSTIPWALKTGNMTLRPFSVAHSILYDEDKGKAIGVRIIDTNTKEVIEYFAKVIFLNAGALNSNLVLLNSKSNRFQEGFGNEYGLLGKFVAFHNYRANVLGEYNGFKDSTTDGRKPATSYIPRFRNLLKQERDFIRGYAVAFSANRSFVQKEDGFGEQLKQGLMAKDLGPWMIKSQMMGETIPKETNYVRLSDHLKDDWGIPQLHISVSYDDNDDKMVKDFHETFSEMFTKAGFTNIKTIDTHRAPGLENHEMGGIRMGNDPKTSMLNKWNQMHACKNVMVSDSGCMTSTSTQNPSLTYMALAARAANHAVEELKKGNL